MSSGTRVAIDVGGTFTDVVTLDGTSAELRFDKVPTTPSRPDEGVLDGFEASGAGLADIMTFTHGTTLGLNALLTRTRGAHRHGRHPRFPRRLPAGSHRPDRDVRHQLPQAAEPGGALRHFEVAERMDFDGTVPVALDEAERAGRGRHDRRRRGWTRSRWRSCTPTPTPPTSRGCARSSPRRRPDVVVTLSHELSREYREYERTSTAVLDAYIKPIVRRYLERLEGQLDDRRLRRPVPDDPLGRRRDDRRGRPRAAGQPDPVRPGRRGGRAPPRSPSLLGNPNLITIDMGGTSLDASLVLDGQPVLHQGAEFEGLPINTPSLYIHTIGAGGGSLAWLDEAGALQVGPAECRSRPGPGVLRAGRHPADLHRRRPGRRLPRGRHAARRAADPGRRQAGRGAATGGGRARGCRWTPGPRRRADLHHQDHGRGPGDHRRGRPRPKDFALLSFGGGGGLVACRRRRELSASHRHRAARPGRVLRVRHADGRRAARLLPHRGRSLGRAGPARCDRPAPRWLPRRRRCWPPRASRRTRRSSSAASTCATPARSTR